MKTVTKTQISERNRPSTGKTIGRLFFLEASAGRILSVNADGSDRKVMLSGCRIPDGVVVDLEAGHIYWTNMGFPNRNDGSIERADLDGRNRKTIVPEGSTFTPKQLHLERKSGKLYWCDREGMRVMRSNLDGSNIETLVDTSNGEERPGTDLTKWCVGIAVDPDHGEIYFAGRRKGPDNAGKGRIFRAKIDIPKRETAANRTDIELLYDGLPEPIDLELDRKNRLIYWTDRGDPPRGNTVNRAPMDADSKQAPRARHFVDASDGGNPDRSRLQRRPDVSDRFSRLDLFRQARRDRKETTARRAGKSHRHRLRRNQHKGELIMSYNKPVHRIAIVGTGVIGASWAAEYLARGFDVVATDPAPNAEANLRKYIDNAWKDLTTIGLSKGASRDRLTFTTDLKEALSKAEFVQENGPERPDFKIKLFADMSDATPVDSLIASSSSGITPSVLQSKCNVRRPGPRPTLSPTMMIECLRRLAGLTSFISKRHLSHCCSMGPDGIFASNILVPLAKPACHHRDRNHMNPANTTMATTAPRKDLERPGIPGAAPAQRLQHAPDPVVKVQTQRAHATM